MNIKSKLIGTIAAAALTLSMFGGVAADTKNTPASATLRGGVCTISVSKSSLGFGTWDYDGLNYVFNSNTTREHNVQWNIKAGDPAGCDATIQFDGLSNTNPLYAGDAIGLENFYGELSWNGLTNGGQLDDPFLDLGNGFSNTNASFQAFFPGFTFPTSTIYGYIQLQQVPDDIMPGTYTGSVVSTVTNGQ